MRADRVQSLYAEAAVLGSMILDPCVIPAALERLTADDFTDEKHKVIFAATLAVWRRVGKDLDGVTLRDELDRSGKSAAAGGVEYLSRIVESVPSSANLVYYRNIVAEAGRYRKLTRTVEAMQEALNQGVDTPEIAEQIRTLALALDADHPRRSIFKAEDFAVEAALAIHDEGPGLPTGLKAIDDIVGGFHAGELIILAARPSVGKTSLALGIAGHVAKTAAVLFITLEMPATRVFQALEGMLGKVNVHALRQNPEHPSIRDFQAAAMEVAKAKLTVLEGCNTVDRIAAAIRMQKQEAPLSLVVVDYLGLLRPVTKNRSRYEDVTEITRSLKLVALSENVPILCLSQLNRAPEGRESHRPRLSDLRDSGSIEQDADTVLMIHREDVRRKTQSWTDSAIDGAAEVAVHKNRSGPTGVAKLVFLEEYMLFTDRSPATDTSLQAEPVQKGVVRHATD